MKLRAKRHRMRHPSPFSGNLKNLITLHLTVNPRNSNFSTLFAEFLNKMRTKEIHIGDMINCFNDKK